MTDMERLEHMLGWCGQLFSMRFHLLETEYPEAPEYELYALWTERMYRGTVPDEMLDKALAEIRYRGTHSLPPYDRL